MEYIYEYNGGPKIKFEKFPKIIFGKKGGLFF
jgi:hypothetical protein